MNGSAEDGRDDLRDDLEAAIRSSVPSWLPGYGPRLSSLRWSELRRSSRIGTENYGTARVRSGDADAERDVCAMCRWPSAFDVEAPLLVETLREGCAGRYVDLGLNLAPAAHASDAPVLAQLRAGLEVLARVPSVAATVGSVLRTLHVAVPEEIDYDVSYSDPEVPFSIFVGIAAEAGKNAPLRVAEGILHEAMHLQLTLVEDVLPLVADPRATHFSPWQSTTRPARGILHGIYVFAVIRDFMRLVRDASDLRRVERDHADGRIATASAEITAASAELLGGGGLTPAGRALVVSLSTSMGG